MSITTRSASISDIEELVRLFDAYRVFYKKESDLPLARSFLEERFANDESKIFVATDSAGRFYGFTQLFPSFSSVSAMRLWVLNDLFVEKAARRKGVGRLLMDKAREFALETGAKGLVLETGESNTGAQALYESLGYKKSSEFFYSLDVQPS